MVRFAVLLFCALLSLNSEGQEKYPQRTVRIIVPFAPGGSTDIFARLVGEKLSQSLGQPVIIDNRPSAGGTTGTDLVAKAAPDG
jgi:tripartite-type tricarboxylate transporter receptor subunit TctC